jgi:hypothetical protein
MSARLNYPPIMLPLLVVQPEPAAGKGPQTDL